MKGGKNRQPLGYTIVEVMVVLAVSGVMFLIAASFINGKQATAAFQTGVNQVASLIQNTIEEVNDGKYSDIAFTCTTPGTPPKVVIDDTANQAQGKHTNCVFLGKLFYFTRSTTGDYFIFTLAGNRVVNDQPVADISNANPQPVVDCDVGGCGHHIDLTTDATIPQSLDIIHIKQITTSSAVLPDIDNFAFIQGLGKLNTGADDSTTYQSGSQSVSLYYINDPALIVAHPGWIETNAGQALSGDNSTKYKPLQSVQMCLSDGTRYATIDIGSTDTVNPNQSSGGLNVSVSMKGNNPC